MMADSEAYARRLRNDAAQQRRDAADVLRRAQACENPRGLPWRPCGPADGQHVLYVSNPDGELAFVIFTPGSRRAIWLSGDGSRCRVFFDWGSGPLKEPREV